MTLSLKNPIPLFALAAIISVAGGLCVGAFPIGLADLFRQLAIRDRRALWNRSQRRPDGSLKVRAFGSDDDVAEGVRRSSEVCGQRMFCDSQMRCALVAA